MSTIYVPGEWSRQYNRLPPADRAAVADQVDEMFRKKTGITRRLDPAKDRELMRTWLRIRDELMERRIAEGRRQAPGFRSPTLVRAC